LVGLGLLATACALRATRRVLFEAASIACQATSLRSSGLVQAAFSFSGQLFRISLGVIWHGLAFGQAFSCFLVVVAIWMLWLLC